MNNCGCRKSRSVRWRTLRAGKRKNREVIEILVFNVGGTAEIVCFRPRIVMNYPGAFFYYAGSKQPRPVQECVKAYSFMCRKRGKEVYIINGFSNRSR